LISSEKTEEKHVDPLKGTVGETGTLELRGLRGAPTPPVYMNSEQRGSAKGGYERNEEVRRNFGTTVFSEEEYRLTTKGATVSKPTEKEDNCLTGDPLKIKIHSF